MPPPDEFYIGYLSHAPAATARFIRNRVGILLTGTVVTAAFAAVALPFLGTGTFAYGETEEMSGTLRCVAGHPMLETVPGDLPLVGFGKHGAPLEWCGSAGKTVVLRTTRIAREGRELLETTALAVGAHSTSPAPTPVALGDVDLVGEIVDAKCYFGVMNPGEARVHRACAQLCIRGGIPAVLVARDTQGAVVHLIIDRTNVADFEHSVLPLVGEPVRVQGEVNRQGQWLVIAPTSVTLIR